MDQPLRAWAGLTTDGLSTRPVFLVQSLARCGSWCYRDGSMPPRDQQVSCEIHVRETIVSAAHLSWVSPPLDPLDIDEGRRAIKRECVFFSKCAIYRNSRSRTVQDDTRVPSTGRTRPTRQHWRRNGRSGSWTNRPGRRCTPSSWNWCTRVIVTPLPPTHTWPRHEFVWRACYTPWWTLSRINSCRYKNQWVSAR